MAKGKYQQWLEPDGLLLLAAWARDGLTDEQLATKLNVNTATLYDWKNKYPEISEALKKGKEIVDIEVENALLKRAKGYEYSETKIEQSAKDGRKVTVIKKHIPPDVGAIAIWLKNRQPTKWRDKPEAQPEMPANDLMEALEQVSEKELDDALQAVQPETESSS